MCLWDGVDGDVVVVVVVVELVLALVVGVGGPVHCDFPDSETNQSRVRVEMERSSAIYFGFPFDNLWDKVTYRRTARDQPFHSYNVSLNLPCIWNL